MEQPSRKVIALADTKLRRVRHLLQLTVLGLSLWSSLTIAGWWVDGSYAKSANEAQALIKDGSRIRIESGTYRQGIVIDADNVEIRGDENVHFKTAGSRIGNHTFFVKGDNVVISGIECSGVSGGRRAASCVVQAGKDLRLENVFFHDSDQGVESRGYSGTLEIIDSRFERIGRAGSGSHVKSNNDKLVIKNSRFVGGRNQSHIIKSRALATVIEYSVIASADSRDSRLLDLPHGGDVSVTHSILQKGPNSTQQQLIGYGLGGLFTPGSTDNRLVVTNNKILMERKKGNWLLAIVDQPGRYISVDFSRNALIGEAGDLEEFAGQNLLFADRDAAGLGDISTWVPWNE